MAEYTLKISAGEVARYRFMAESAQAMERDAWTRAGIVPGAVVADVGCGPAAVSVVLAGIVGDTGRVIAVERDATSLEHARQLVAESGAANVDLQGGDASDTGIAAGSVDVVMMRHVLAHNGGREHAIVDHLASLVRPGGVVYLVDVDLTAVRLHRVPDDLADLNPAYVRFHAERGNDPMVGLRLGDLLRDVGLVDVEHTGSYVITPIPPGIRPPAYAARDSMVASGVVTDADIARWTGAFDELDGRTERPMLFAPGFIASGRRPG